MAVRFDAAADRLLRTADLPSYDAVYRVTLRFRAAALPGSGAYAGLFLLNRNAATENFDGLALYTASGVTRVAVIAAGAGGAGFAQVTSTTAIAAGTWYTVDLVRSANNVRALYVNGALEATLTSSYSGRAAPTRMEIGAITTGNASPFSGRVAGVMVWTATADAAQVAAQYESLEPLITSGLHLWTPLVTHTDLTDDSGGGRDWTAGGTLTTEDGPPASYAEGGQGTAVSLAGGADALAVAEAGQGSAVSLAGGADALAASEAGAGLISALAGASDVLAVVGAGQGSAAALASGGDTHTAQDAGQSTALSLAGGSDALAASEAGQGTAAALAGGADVFRGGGAWSEAGGATAGASAGGADVLRMVEAGGGVMAALAGGLASGGAAIQGRITVAATAALPQITASAALPQITATVSLPRVAASIAD